MSNFWDERFSSDEYIYGKEPNLFFKEQIDKLKPAKILLAGEGEGRNAVYAAEKGWEAYCIDSSIKAKEKALALAEEKKVKINYEIHDLIDFIPQKNFYQAAAIIFIHMPSSVRSFFHEKIIESLTPGGKIILEAFDKSQLGNSSGGPKEIDLLYSTEILEQDFKGLKIELLEKKRLMLAEGSHHKGEAVTVRMVAVKT
ncbi:MAG: class I SAM-dependent methyltransferase [Ignavibacteriaceae bacterium]|nr:class I SAM-dependent methyltransferase [Ignavibacteriaceae bacterium]